MYKRCSGEIVFAPHFPLDFKTYFRGRLLPTTHRTGPVRHQHIEVSSLVYRNADVLLPETTRLFREGVRSATELFELHDSAPSKNAFKESVLLKGDMTGSIEWHYLVDEPFLAEVTELSRSFLHQTMTTLSGLIDEVYGIFEVQKTRPHLRNEFPLVGDLESFAGLVSGSLFTHLPSDVARLFYLCQPFQSGDTLVQLEGIRQGFNHLHRWNAFLKDGNQLGFWLVAKQLQLVARKCVTLQAHGQLPRSVWIDKSGKQEAITFGIGGARYGEPIRCSANSTWHLGFKDDPEGSALPEVVGSIVSATQNFIGLTTHTVNQSSLSKSLVPHQTRDPQRTVLFSAKGKVSIHNILPASPILPSDSGGHAVEETIGSAVAQWGLPDFVFQPVKERKGAAVREIADGLVIVGNLGLVIQAKTRTESTGDLDRERRWVSKQISKACRQSDGTIRRLKSGDVELTNGRGRNLLFRAGEVSWLGVVIIENPAVEDFCFEPPVTNEPYRVLTRSDWEFLFASLQSTYAVANYLNRVEESEMLGHESLRYIELAHEDLSATRESVPKMNIPAGMRHQSFPMLPLDLPNAGTKEQHVYRELMEAVADCDFADEESDNLHRILSDLDVVPPQARADLGGKILASLNKLQNNENLFESRIFFSGSSRMVGFAVQSWSEKNIQIFKAWAQLRHSEALRMGRSSNDLISVLLMIGPSHVESRRFEVAVIRLEGDLGLSEEELSAMRQIVPPSAP